MAFQTEIWTYAGRRQLRSRAGLALCFIDPDGEKMLYRISKGLKHRTIGAQYEVEVERDVRGGATAKLSDAVYVNSPGTTSQALLDEWEVEDRAAFTADELRKREASAKTNTDTWDNMSLGDLRMYARKLPAGQKQALVAQIINYIYG